MEAKLESKEFEYRGVSLISQTEEEKQILTNIWIDKGRPVAFFRLKNGQVKLCIAPTLDEDGV